MNIAIIAAAGQGTRMDGGRAKQFLELAGTPIIIHTLRRFEQCDDIHELVVVLPAQDVADFVALADDYSLRRPLQVVAGGETRSESVWRGLQSVKASAKDIIVVHDGVRPFVAVDEISSTIRAAEKYGAAILAAAVTDTIKVIQDHNVKQTFDRNRLRRALTPQCFRYELIRRAYQQAPDGGLDATDCSVLVERLGEVVSIVEGHPRNIKITRKEDLAYGEILMREDAEGRTQNTGVRTQNTGHRTQDDEEETTSF